MAAEAAAAPGRFLADLVKPRAQPPPRRQRQRRKLKRRQESLRGPRGSERGQFFFGRLSRRSLAVAAGAAVGPRRVGPSASFSVLFCGGRGGLLGPGPRRCRRGALRGRSRRRRGRVRGGSYGRGFVAFSLRRRLWRGVLGRRAAAAEGAPRSCRRRRRSRRGLFFCYSFSAASPACFHDARRRGARRAGLAHRLLPRRKRRRRRWRRRQQRLCRRRQDRQSSHLPSSLFFFFFFFSFFFLALGRVQGRHLLFRGLRPALLVVVGAEE